MTNLKKTAPIAISQLYQGRQNFSRAVTRPELGREKERILDMEYKKITISMHCWTQKPTPQRFWCRTGHLGCNECHKKCGALWNQHGVSVEHRVRSQSTLYCTVKNHEPTWGKPLQSPSRWQAGDPWLSW